MGSLYCLSNFDVALQQGKVGESIIANWLKAKGWNVLPVYEIEIQTNKGPRLFCQNSEIIAPDILAFKENAAIWIEAKHKNAFSWHRLTNQWVTGIDLRHYEEYLRIGKESSWPIWLLFLHRGGIAKDSGISPKGLFGGDLNYLKNHENHRSQNWGSGGMVYWAIKHLKQLQL